MNNHIVQDIRKRLKDGEDKISVLDSLSTKQQRELALFALGEIEQQIERGKQQEIEREAWKPLASDWKTERDLKEVQWNIEREQRDKYFAQIFKNPGMVYGGLHGIMNTHDRQGFKSWCKRNNKKIDPWIERAKKSASPESLEMCLADWYPDGPAMYLRHQEMNFIRKSVYVVIDEIKKKTRLEVTKELLSSSFALGDGRTVTWGEATIEEHTIRIELLNNNAVGNIEAAARHSLAVDILKKNKASCLAEVKKAG